MHRKYVQATTSEDVARVAVQAIKEEVLCEAAAVSLQRCARTHTRERQILGLTWLNCRRT